VDLPTAGSDDMSQMVGRHIRGDTLEAPDIACGGGTSDEPLAGDGCERGAEAGDR
jgi:hypothetical protein